MHVTDYLVTAAYYNVLHDGKLIALCKLILCCWKYSHELGSQQSFEGKCLLFFTCSWNRHTLKGVKVMVSAWFLAPLLLGSREIVVAFRAADGSAGVSKIFVFISELSLWRLPEDIVGRSWMTSVTAPCYGFENICFYIGTITVVSP